MGVARVAIGPVDHYALPLLRNKKRVHIVCDTP